MLRRVERIDERLAALHKPEVEYLDSPQFEDDDILILAAGFEDRAFEILKRVTSTDCSSIKVLIINYLPYIKINKTEVIRKLCSENGISQYEVTYDRQNPAGIGEKVLEIIKNLEGNIYVDISAMSRLLIVQIIVALGTVHSLNRSNILYSEAQSYPPTQDEVNIHLQKATENSIYRTIFLSSGVFEVTVVPELSSVTFQGQPVRLITFPSFNVDQFAALRGELQPSNITLIHGKPPLKENYWREDAIKKLNHTEEILLRKDLSASTLDYRETLNCLLDIYFEHNTMERIILAPIGSKMQAVAVGIFRVFMNDVQVAYPTPRLFAAPSKYTTGVRQVYQLKLNAFSKVAAKI